MNFSSFEALLTEITPKMDFINGVSYIFDSEGRRITGLDQIHDGGISTTKIFVKTIKLFVREFLGIYICSSSKKFVPGNYGAYGDGFRVDQDSDPIPNPKNDGLIR